MKPIYPEIMNIKYKDKFVKADISLRIRLIRVKDYHCPICLINLSQSKLYSWYKENVELIETRTGLHRYGYGCMYVRKHDLYMIPELVRENPESPDIPEMIYCPLCFANHTLTTLELSEHELIKVYSQPSPQYVNYQKIISDFILGRWKEENSSWGFSPTNPKIKSSFYADELEKIYKLLDESVARNSGKTITTGNKKPRKVKKKHSIKIILNKNITMEQLRNDYEKYQYRKFLRKL